MANKEQLAILKQGVAVWNKWREENPDTKIDLRDENFSNFNGAKFSNFNGANFRNSDIRGADFSFTTLAGADFNGSILGYGIDCRKRVYGSEIMRGTIFLCSDLTGAILDNIIIDGVYSSLCKVVYFSRAILDYSSWKNFQMKIDSGDDECFRETPLASRTILELLSRGCGQSLYLKGENLEKMRLVNFDLRRVDLRKSNLLSTDMRGADITGAKLWGSARENWIIDGIRCDYIYWDEAGEQRTPPDRDFRPGEFEELYKQLPSFEYVFANGFTPLDPLIMNRVVEAINERHKEFSLELVNFDKRGQPHATFTVCRLDYVDAAKGQLAALYEKTIAYLMKENEDKKRIIDRMNDFIDQLLKKTPSIEGVKMGDTYNNYGQAAAMGPNASVVGNIFQQITAELPRVHEEMRRSAASPEQKAATEDVAKATQAAQQQNEPAVRQHLKNAGKFALDCAQKIGAEALAEYLKKMTLGL